MSAKIDTRMKEILKKQILQQGGARDDDDDDSERESDRESDEEEDIKDPYADKLKEFMENRKQLGICRNFKSKYYDVGSRELLNSLAPILKKMVAQKNKKDITKTKTADMCSKKILRGTPHRPTQINRDAVTQWLYDKGYYNDDTKVCNTVYAKSKKGNQEIDNLIRNYWREPYESMNDCVISFYRKMTGNLNPDEEDEAITYDYMVERDLIDQETKTCDYSPTRIPYMKKAFLRHLKSLKTPVKKTRARRAPARRAPARRAPARRAPARRRR